jgi:hypothetical protein
LRGRGPSGIGWHRRCRPSFRVSRERTCSGAGIHTTTETRTAVCFRENVAGRECSVPCDLCDVIAEPGFCFARCLRPRALRYPALGPDVPCNDAAVQVVEKTPRCPRTLAILTSALSCSQRNAIIDARSAVASSQVWCSLAIPSE